VRPVAPDDSEIMQSVARSKLGPSSESSLLKHGWGALPGAIVGVFKVSSAVTGTEHGSASVVVESLDPRAALRANGHIGHPVTLSPLLTTDLDSAVAAAQHRDVTSDHALVLRAHERFAARTGWTTSATHRSTPDRLLRVSHQPNLFASLNIVGLLSIAGSVQLDGARTVFVGLDYDSADDQRFRSGLVPAASHDRSVVLGGMIGRQERNRVAASLPPRDPAVVLRASTALRQSVGHWRRAQRTFTGGTRRDSAAVGPYEAIAQYGAGLSAPGRLTDAAISGIARLANEHLGLEVLPLASSDLIAAAAESAGGIVRDLLRRDGGAADQLAWRICDGCYMRCPSSLHISDDEVIASWVCTRCAAAQVEPLDFGADTDALPRFVPRIHLCDAIDLTLLGSTVSLAYAGGAKHSFDSRVEYVDGGGTVVPEFVWDPTNIDAGQGWPADEGTHVHEQRRRGRYSAWWYLGVIGPDALHAVVKSSSRPVAQGKKEGLKGKYEQR
jgi:hypothetical protein